MCAALIGIDLGTTGCRSVVFDEGLNILGEEYIEYPLINISETEIEQDANLWWALTRQVVKNSVYNSNIDPSAIKGISMSSQGISFVPVDINCEPLRNALSWLDTRAKSQVKQIGQCFCAEDIFRKTGKRISEAYLLPKLLWLKQNEPEIYSKTYKFLMALDFVTAKLCGRYITDHTMASGTIMYDITRQDWSEDILQQFGLERSKLPEIKWSGTAVGTLSKSVAQELGLGNDVTVSVGGQDQKCAALGAGIQPDAATVSLGTATAITRKWGHPVIDPEMKIPCFSDLLRNSWVTEGVIGTSCVSFKWLKNTLFPDKSYRELDLMAENRSERVSDVLFYPFLAGTGTPNWYQDSKGVFYGITLSTTSEEIVKSVLEGIAYQIKSNIMLMESPLEPVNEIRLFGGGAKSEVWCRIIADITGKRVAIPFTPETACAGAAILAGLGAGVYGSTEEASRQITITREFYPDARMNRYYEEKFNEYIRMQHRIFQ